MKYSRTDSWPRLSHLNTHQKDSQEGKNLEDDSSEKENLGLLAQNKYRGSLDEEVGPLQIFLF